MDKIEIGRTRMDKPMVSKEGYQYYLKQENKVTFSFRCRTRTCKAYLVMSKDLKRIKKENEHHNHDKIKKASCATAGPVEGPPVKTKSEKTPPQLQKFPNNGIALFFYFFVYLEVTKH